MASLTQSLSELRELVMDREAWRAATELNCACPGEDINLEFSISHVPLQY